MDLAGFFALLLPEGPFLCMATLPAEGDKDGWSNRFVPSQDSLTELVNREVARGRKVVYYACASYKTKNSRKATNVDRLKTLWIDIDCGPNKHYATFTDASRAVEDYCQITGMPRPMQVLSGRGLHCYWPLTSPVPADHWQVLASANRRALAPHVLHDAGLSINRACVLRPLGSWNTKVLGHPVQVRVLDEGDGAHDLAYYAQVLLRGPTAVAAPAAADEPLVEVPSYIKAADTSTNDDVSITYAPSDADCVADRCAQIRWFRDTGSSDYEPHWRAALGVVKHCTDGEKIAHEWSAKDQRYDQSETQKKIDGWEHGPATCDSFGNHRKNCDGCPHRGKIKSPIQLGVLEPPKEQTVIEVVDEETGEEIEEHFPSGYGFNGQSLVAYRKDDEGVLQPRPFCNMLFYPYARFRDADGTMVLGIHQRVRKREDGSWDWRKFTLPTEAVGAKRSALHGALARFEVIAAPGGAKLLEDYMSAWTDEMRRRADEVPMHKNFGWQADGTFLLGRTQHQPGGVSREVVLNGDLVGFAGSMEPRGSADRWAEIVNRLYNYPGFAKHYFVIYAGFGSALAEMVGMPTGCPINLFGGRGSGKSSAASVAVSIYGRVDNGLGIGAENTTYKALISRLSVLHNVPSLIDEITNMDSKTVGRLLYDMANGFPPDRLTSAGNRKSPLPAWSSINFTTSNASLIDKLLALKENASAEMSHMIEIQWGNEATQHFRLPDYEATSLIKELALHAGSPGAKYIRVLTDLGRDQLAKHVEAMQRKVASEADLTQDARFWSRMGACILLGGRIATSLGLVNYDWTAVYQYTIELLRQQKATVDDAEPDITESFHSMVTALSPGIISTYKDDMNGLEGVVGMRVPPVGRILRATGVLYLKSSAIAEWCEARQLSQREMQRTLAEQGLLIEAGVRYSIGRGTTIATGQDRCWKLDWSRLCNEPRLAGVGEQTDAGPAERASLKLVS